MYVFCTMPSQIEFNPFTAAVSDITYGSTKGPILPVHTITQSQNSQLRGLQQPTNANWNPYLPGDVTAISGVHSPSFTSLERPGCFLTLNDILCGTNLLAQSATSSNEKL